jgi:hypothetical protein
VEAFLSWHVSSVQTTYSCVISKTPFVLSLDIVAALTWQTTTESAGPLAKSVHVHFVLNWHTQHLTKLCLSLAGVSSSDTCDCNLTITFWNSLISNCAVDSCVQYYSDYDSWVRWGLRGSLGQRLCVMCERVSGCVSCVRGCESCERVRGCVSCVVGWGWEVLCHVFEGEILWMIWVRYYPSSY